MKFSFLITFYFTTAIVLIISLLDITSAQLLKYILLLSIFQLKKNEMKETKSKSEITNKKYARTFTLFFENTLVLRLLNDFFIFNSLQI